MEISANCPGKMELMWMLPVAAFSCWVSVQVLFKLNSFKPGHQEWKPPAWGLLLGSRHLAACTIKNEGGYYGENLFCSFYGVIEGLEVEGSRHSYQHKYTELAA